MGYLYTALILLITMLLLHLFTSEDKVLGKILFWAFVARAGVMLFDSFVYSGLPYLTASDASRFHQMGLRFAEFGFAELIYPPYPTGSTLYAYWIGMVYSFFGTEERAVVKAFNILAGVFTVYNGYHISRLLWTRGIAIQNAWILALFPLLVVYSQNFLREAFFAYFLTLGIWYFLSWYKLGRTHHIFFSILSISLSSAFHVGALMSLLALALYNVWIFFHSFFIGKTYSAGRTIFSTLVLLGGLYFMNATGWGLPSIGGEGALQEFGVEELIEERGGDRRTGRAAYLTGMTASSTADVVWQTPIRAVYFLFAPFPWMLNSVWDLVGLMDALFYLLILFGIYKSLPVIRQNPSRVIILLMLLGMVIMFAWGVTNYGTGMRHRAKIVTLAICVAPSLYPFRRLVFDRAKQTWNVIYTSRWFRN